MVDEYKPAAMRTIDPRETTIPAMHSYLLGAVIPRPIALASTIDKAGNINLSPFSFFNCFSANPPILVFSPSRRGRDNTTKHTFDNIREVPEVVIHIVTYSMVEQASLSSCEFPKGVDEFVKSGLTAVPSQMVRPPRVAESPVAFECKVNQVVELGTSGAAGNLVICEVLKMHIRESVLDGSGKIDPHRLDAVARMGGNNYVRVQGENIFSVPKPNEKLGIGFDQLPEHILRSPVLTGNDLGKLANIEILPVWSDTDEVFKAAGFVQARKQGERAIHEYAQQLLQQGKLVEAWKVLLASERG
ncbi:MAG: flavin reductase family protein [Cytophagales bacterium]|nr:flavin reductase family protein [Cytophagales bacterium]